MAYFYGLGVILIEVTNIKCIRCIDFASRRNQRRWILQHVDLLPVDVLEERVLLDLAGSTTHAAQTLVDVPMQQQLEQIAHLVIHAVGQLDEHCHGHAIDFKLVFGPVLAKGRVAF